MASTTIQVFERKKATLQRLVNDWKMNRARLIDELSEIADRIEKNNKNSRIARLTGASASVAGTTMTVVGAVEAPLTLGASLGLTIGGGTLAAAGGVTTAGSSLTDHFLRRTNVK